MNWRSVKFDWNRARAFLVTAEEGSLSAAARALGMTQPTLSRQVDALEKELGLVLFERAGRGLFLTPSGFELLEHVRPMGEAASRVSLSASGQSQAIEGKIRITASEVYSAYLLPPILTKLHASYPGIEIELVASNSPTDLRRREADIAIRSFSSTDPDLIIRKLRDDNAYLYAAETYLSRLEGLSTMADLARAEFLGFSNTDLLMDGLNAHGLNLTKRNFPITCDSHFVQWELVKRGAGIGVITANIGEHEPLVRRVLPDMAPIVVPMWLATHRELNTSKRVRTVFDFLAAALSRHGDHPPV
ncbi:LysR family transcriptional regulator [Hyphomonas sp.]|uniref:LysR family transcriptional regulator n=1 Tax=Hyphomonas sp. TaxID=87 RepID=UPI0025C39CE0|nr:LysR family transcriptional regulator [Hyphomonas sp.]